MRLATSRTQSNCVALMGAERVGSRLVGLVAGLTTIVMIAAVGCSSQEDGDPTADDSQTPTKGEGDGAPRVDTPLDATRFLTEPCAVLDQEQLAEFGVTSPGIPTTTGATAETVGPYCIWHADPALGSTIGVGFETGNKHGLSDTYRGRDQFEYFEPTTVDGYPAVYSDGADLRSQGSCVIGVGISDTLAFNASEQGELDADGACERARQVAAAALATLKGDS